MAGRYEMEFLHDLEQLGIQRPTLMTKVTQFMPQIMLFIQKLLEQGVAYKTEDGSVYFNVTEFSKHYKYGKLKPISEPPHSKSKDDFKKSLLDFALWKASKSNLEPSWVSSWGSKGRPGWHVSDHITLLYTWYLVGSSL